jgi:hypothetical protein
MMMKKLLVLLTVLAFAGTASATLTIVAPAELGQVGASAAIGVDVVEAEPATIAQALVITNSAVLSVDSAGVGIAALGIDEFVADLASDPDMVAFLGDIGLTDVVAALYYEAVHLSIPPMDLPVGALISGATVTGVAEGIGGAALVDMSAGAIVASQDIVVVPEPMTIALLGLGGLFLRRRK